MRTSEARRMRDKALKRARKQGHDVALITKSGALELYGCRNKCDAVMDIWDSPAMINGPLAEVECRDRRLPPPPLFDRMAIANFGMAIATLTRRAAKYFYTQARKFLTRWIGTP